MEMNVERRIAASPEQVWAALNDTEILKASIPGCENLEAIGATSFKAQITARVGPVKAKFKFDVTLSDINPPKSYKISAEGQGGAAGFANGSVTVTLRADAADTILAYSVKANVGGKLAQLGARLIEGAASKMADEFFNNFSALAVDYESLDSATIALVASARKELGIPDWIWLTGLVVLALLALLFIF